MNTKTKMMTRRRVLRGVMDGAVVSVGLPFLDCFLDSHGGALAATGAPLPVCFGIWWQGLGLTPGRWLPDTVGAGYENKIELKVLDPFRSCTNIISGTKYFLDGKPLETHLTGWQIASIGTIPSGAESGPSLDSNIADVVGTQTRFRSLEVSVGGTTESFSKRAAAAAIHRNPRRSHCMRASSDPISKIRMQPISSPIRWYSRAAVCCPSSRTSARA